MKGVAVITGEWYTEFISYGTGGRARFETAVRRIILLPAVSERCFYVRKGGKTMKKNVFRMILCVLLAGLMLTGCVTITMPEVPAEETAMTVNTVILKEADDSMINTYTLIAVNPDAPFTDADGNAVGGVALNTAGADALIEWLLSEEGINAAAAYGQEEYGDSLFYVLDGHTEYTGEIAPATEETKQIRLSTTTSVNDSGLLGSILPVFEGKYGYTVEIQSAGTGKAIAAAKNGNADLILVHAKAKEQEFVDGGFGRKVADFDAERQSFLYNYFVLCGPAEDPADVKNAGDVKAAFAAIAEGKHPFISRGDGSGTHTKELALWPEELGITEDAESFRDYTDWYISANAGMGACLVMAEEMLGYILSDKATFLTFQKNNGVME